MLGGYLPGLGMAPLDLSTFTARGRWPVKEVQATENHNFQEGRGRFGGRNNLRLCRGRWHREVGTTIFHNHNQSSGWRSWWQVRYCSDLLPIGPYSFSYPHPLLPITSSSSSSHPHVGIRQASHEECCLEVWGLSFWLISFLDDNMNTSYHSLIMAQSWSLRNINK